MASVNDPFGLEDMNRAWGSAVKWPSADDPFGLEMLASKWSIIKPEERTFFEQPTQTEKPFYWDINTPETDVASLNVPDSVIGERVVQAEKPKFTDLVQKMTDNQQLIDVANQAEQKEQERQQQIQQQNVQTLNDYIEQNEKAGTIENSAFLKYYGNQEIQKLRSAIDEWTIQKWWEEVADLVKDARFDSWLFTEVSDMMKYSDATKETQWRALSNLKQHLIEENDLKWELWKENATYYKDWKLLTSDSIIETIFDAPDSKYTVKISENAKLLGEVELSQDDIQYLSEMYQDAFKKSEAYAEVVIMNQKREEARDKLWLSDFEKLIDKKDEEYFLNQSFSTYQKMMETDEEYMALNEDKKAQVNKYATQLMQSWLISDIYWFYSQIADVNTKLQLWYWRYAWYSQETKDYVAQQQKDMQNILQQMSQARGRVNAYYQMYGGDEHKVRDRMYKDMWVEPWTAMQVATTTTLLESYLLNWINTDDVAAWRLRLMGWDVQNIISQITMQKQQDIDARLNTDSPTFWRFLETLAIEWGRRVSWWVTTLWQMIQWWFGTTVWFALDFTPIDGAIMSAGQENLWLYKENYEEASSVERMAANIWGVLPEVAEIIVWQKGINKLFDAWEKFFATRWLVKAIWKIPWNELKTLSKLQKGEVLNTAIKSRILKPISEMAKSRVEDALIWNGMDTSINDDTQAKFSLFGSYVSLLGTWLWRAWLEKVANILNGKGLSSFQTTDVINYYRKNPEVLWEMVERALGDWMKLNGYLWVPDMVNKILDDTLVLSNEIKRIKELDPTWRMKKISDAYVWASLNALLGKDMQGSQMRDYLIKVMNDDKITIPDIIKERINMVWEMTFDDIKSKKYLKIDSEMYKKNYVPKELDVLQDWFFDTSKVWKEEEIQWMIKKASWKKDEQVKQVLEVFGNKEKYFNNLWDWYYTLNKEWFDALWVRLEKAEPTVFWTMSKDTEAFTDKLRSVQASDWTRIFSDEFIERIQNIDWYSRLSSQLSDFVC